MALIHELDKNKNMRMLFGSRELEIIKKQLLGIQLTHSETTRLSRDIRKKFRAIKELSEHSNEFDLKKGAEIKFLIEEAKEIILEHAFSSRIKKIIIFGSAVENKLTFRSDLDIAVEFIKITSKEATKFRAQISGKVSNRIDIQVYNFLPEKIKKQIKKNHKIIYSK